MCRKARLAFDIFCEALHRMLSRILFIDSVEVGHSKEMKNGEKKMSEISLGETSTNRTQSKNPRMDIENHEGALGGLDIERRIGLQMTL